MTYHQVLGVGGADVTAEIDYEIDDDTNTLWIVSIRIQGVDMLGAFIEQQIDQIERDLWKRHDSVIREMDWLHAEDKAADRAAFRDAYNDHPLGV